MSKPGTTARRGMMTYVAIIFVIACVVAVLYMVIGHPGAPAPEATKISFAQPITGADLSQRELKG